MKGFREICPLVQLPRVTQLHMAIVVTLAVGAGTAEAALQARDLNGDTVTDAYYDTVLNITWLANANAGAGSSYDDGVSTTDGRMTWQNAVNWATGLSYTVGSTVYDDWRLPFVTDTGTPGCDFAYSGTDCGYNVQTKDGSTVYSELAHMFYNTLGNKAYYDTSGTPQSGWGLHNAGPFSNLQSYVYWSGTGYAPNPSYAWQFVNSTGYQVNNLKDRELYAWAVRDGDIAAVPLPAALPLFGSALAGLGLIGWRRRKLAA
jgi:hypothetical protein